ENGVEIDYSIDEAKVDGYATEINGHNLTNVRIGTIEITGEKTWVEVDEQYRPESITINLLANGEQVDTLKVSEATNWTYTSSKLDKFDENGVEIAYTIEEIDVIGYESEVDGYNITNTQETTEVSGTKTWKDGDSEDRPQS